MDKEGNVQMDKEANVEIGTIFGTPVDSAPILDSITSPPIVTEDPKNKGKKSKNRKPAGKRTTSK